MRRMKIRSISFRACLCAVVFGATLGVPAQALEVIRARYGTDRKGFDVSDIVQGYANRGVRSFYVNNASMGGDPEKAKKKELTVEYVNRGRRYRDSAKEGTHFQFQGPLLGGGGGYHFHQGIDGAERAELVIDNELSAPVTAYSLDRWGSWRWVGTIDPGRALAAPAYIGQQWRVTGPRGRTVEEITVRRRQQREVLREGGIQLPFPPVFGGGGYGRPDDYYYGGGGAYVGTLTVQNTLRVPVRVYTINPGRDWQFVRVLRAGESGQFATEPRRRWIVTDLANRVLRSVEAEPGNALLRL